MRLAICLASAAAALALPPLPASAQALPPHEIAASVWSMGLRPLSSPVRQGPRYVMRAVDRRGSEVKVAADAYTGRVLFVEPVGYRGGPAVADRSYPPAYPEEAVPSRRSYGPQDGYQRQVPRDPSEPSVIYAPRNNGTGTANANPPTPYRAPSAAKPPSKVAAKPPAKPAEPAAEGSATAEKPADTATTDGTNAAAPSAPPAEKNPALVAPPAQAFD